MEKPVINIQKWFIQSKAATIGYFNDDSLFFVERLPREDMEEEINKRIEFFKTDHQRLLDLGFQCVLPFQRYVIQKGKTIVLQARRFNDKNDFPHDGLNNGSRVNGKWIPQFCGDVNMSMSDHVLRVLRSLEIDVWLEANDITREAFLKKLPMALRNEIPTRSRIERP